MMENIVKVLAVILILIGVIFEITSVVGIFKMKYVLNRMHSAAMGDTLAVLMVLLGLILLCGFTFTSLKLAVIIVFFWIASPVSSHLIANLVTKVDSEDALKKAKLIECEPEKNN